MKKTFSSFVLFTLIFIVVISSLIGHNDSYVSNITNTTLKDANTIESKQDINDELLELTNVGDKIVNLYVEDNKILFNKSNVISDLPYSTLNKIYTSDKNTWSIVTNNLKESYTYDNNVLTIDDTNITNISISFLYNDEEINLAIIKENNVYRLYESKIKLVHGDINSLWYTYFHDLNDAIKAANKEDTIVLYEDITINNTIDINKSINIISDTGINTIKNEKGFAFNITGKNIKLNITNVLIETDSFVKGKYNGNSILLDNSKVVYKNKIYSNKEFKSIIKPTDGNIFIKTSL